MVCMSGRLRISMRDIRADGIFEELVAFGMVIILFSAGTVMCTEFYGLCHDNLSADDMYVKAWEITGKIRNHEQLVYHGRSGMFDITKLIELEDKDLEELVIIPQENSLALEIVEISQIENAFYLSLSTGDFSRTGTVNVNCAVVVSAVNLYINDLEIHAAKLIVTFW